MDTVQILQLLHAYITKTNKVYLLFYSSLQIYILIITWQTFKYVKCSRKILRLYCTLVTRFLTH